MGDISLTTSWKFNRRLKSINQGLEEIALDTNKGEDHFTKKYMLSKIKEYHQAIREIDESSFNFLKLVVIYPEMSDNEISLTDIENFIERYNK